MPTDTDDVVRDMGEMLPSQAIDVAEHAKRLQALFTPAELDLLGMMQ